jgi:exodeoxyribonuclease VII small subunit
MTQTTASQPTELAFEQGYERLQAIANRLNEDEVPVSEMCDLFAEGKGLERALTEFLDTQRHRVEAIERGEGIREFHISRTTPASINPVRQESTGDFVGPDDFVTPSQDQARRAPSPSTGAADDDIPF